METSTRLPVVHILDKYWFIDFKLKQFRAIDNPSDNPHEYFGFEHFEEINAKFSAITDDNLLKEQERVSEMLSRFSHLHEPDADEEDNYQDICIEIAIRTGQGLFKCQACNYLAMTPEMVELHEQICRKLHGSGGPPILR